MERDWRDIDYQEQYDRIGKKLIESLSEFVDSYSEDEKRINLYDNNKKRLFSYIKVSKELYYNSDINKLIDELIPTYIWARHGKYVVSDMFEEFFPDYEVRTVTPAGMN